MNRQDSTYAPAMAGSSICDHREVLERERGDRAVQFTEISGEFEGLQFDPDEAVRDTGVGGKIQLTPARIASS